MSVGIVSYGAYIPRLRIRVDEIARVWGEDVERVKRGLGVEEKSVADMDEDATTMGVEASRYALERVKVDPKLIDAVYVGSESHPYAVKPTSTIVAEAIGAKTSIMASDTEFACKAGTAAMQICMGMVEAGHIRYGLAVGTDKSQAAPGDALEYTASSGAAAFILGRDNLLAEIEGTFSFTTDTPDFWRRDGARYPSHGGRFTGEPAYFKHVIGATKGLMERLGTNPDDYDFLVLHQPNGKFPVQAAMEMGFRREQVLPTLVVGKIGNAYSASSLLGLCKILDGCRGGERILMTSYGSGAGSDSFSIRVLREAPRGIPTVDEMISMAKYIDYSRYIRCCEMI